MVYTIPEVGIYIENLSKEQKGTEQGKLASASGTPGPGYDHFINWHSIEEMIIGNIGYTYLDKNIEIDNCDDVNNLKSDEYLNPKQQTSSPIPMPTEMTTKDTFFNYKLPKFPILNSDDVLINYIDGVFSVDPFVCIIPVESTKILLKTGESFKAPGNFSPVDVSQFGSFKKTPQDNKIYLKDILVNLGFFHQTYLNTKNLSELLIALLNGISDSCGNLWDFQLIVDEDYSAKISIVDTKTVSDDAIIPPDTFNYFKLFNKDSSVREASLTTNVPANMKNSIMLDAFLEYDIAKGGGKTVKDYEQVGFGYLYDQSVRSLLRENKMRPIDAGENLVGEAKNTETDSEKGAKIFDSISSQLSTAYMDIRTKRTSENVDRAKQLLRTYLAQFVKTSSGKPLPHKNFILFPLSLNLKIDGIAGIKWGNKIMIDYIPKRYIDNSVFQVTHVKHDISNSDWTTDIETIWRCIQPDSTQNSGQLTLEKQTSATDPCWEKINPKTAKDGERTLTGSSGTRLYFPDRGNKTKVSGLRNGYIPADKLKPLSFNPLIRLDPSAAYWMEKMNAAFESEKKAGHLSILEGYRSFEQQIYCKEKWMEKGKCQMAAEPGQSNHGLGTAVDFIQTIFIKGGMMHNWMTINSKKYNWYPLQSEYWHWDFKGTTSL